MSTEDNNNAPQAADTGVSFANDVEDQQANSGLTRKTSTELLHAKDRASLSASAKAWDLDGDGELDDAEMALRDMDKGHKGTLNKEQMYKLMSDNLKTQRELFKVKKVVIGLVVFTCILKIVVDLDFDKEFSRRRMQDCSGGNGNNPLLCNWDSSTFVTIADGENIVESCAASKTVTISKSFSSGAAVVHQVCPALSGSIAYDDYTNGNGNNASPRIMTVGSIDIRPNVANTAYIITGLLSAQFQPCDDNNHCESSLVCASGVCSTPTATVTLANINEACTASTCAGGLVCDTTLSVCRKIDGSECTPGSTTECSGGFKCLEGIRGAFFGSLRPSRRLQVEGEIAGGAQMPPDGPLLSYCLCDQTDQGTALSSCPGASMCTIECGISPDSVNQSCMTQEELNSNCALNYIGTNTCDTTTLVSPGMHGQCI